MAFTQKIKHNIILLFLLFLFQEPFMKGFSSQTEDEAFELQLY